jgi:hypothetical protein
MVIILMLQISLKKSFEEGCQCLNSINILQIALSLQNISIKLINIKINVYFWQPGFQKGDNWNASRTHRVIFFWSAIIEPKFVFTRYNNRQSSEQNNRMLISLHDNGEDEKRAHGFANFYLLGTYFDLKHAWIAY